MAADPEPRPPSPFQRFVRVIAGVPKAEVDAEQAKLDAKPRKERGQKPASKRVP